MEFTFPLKKTQTQSQTQTQTCCNTHFYTFSCSSLLSTKTALIGKAQKMEQLRAPDHCIFTDPNPTPRLAKPRAPLCFHWLSWPDWHIKVRSTLKHLAQFRDLLSFHRRSLCCYLRSRCLRACSRGMNLEPRGEGKRELGLLPGSRDLLPRVWIPSQQLSAALPWNQKWIWEWSWPPLKKRCIA